MDIYQTKKWLQTQKHWIKDNTRQLLTIPTVISALNFCALLIQSLSDGKIDEQELHTILTASSGFDLIILLLVVIVLKLN